MPAYTLGRWPSSPWNWRRVLTTSTGFMTQIAVAAANPAHRKFSIGDPRGRGAGRRGDGRTRSPEKKPDTKHTSII